MKCIHGTFVCALTLHCSEIAILDLAEVFSSEEEGDAVEDEDDVEDEEDGLDEGGEVPGHAIPHLHRDL